MNLPYQGVAQANACDWNTNTSMLSIR